MTGFDDPYLEAFGMKRSLHEWAQANKSLSWPIVRWRLWLGETPEAIVQANHLPVRGEKVPRQNGEYPKSRYRGVSYSATHGLWKARIKQAGRAYLLGYTAKEDLAAHMYDCAAITLYGPDAKLNFEQPLKTYSQSLPKDDGEPKTA